MFFDEIFDAEETKENQSIQEWDETSWEKLKITKTKASSIVEAELYGVWFNKQKSRCRY